MDATVSSYSASACVRGMCSRELFFCLVKCNYIVTCVVIQRKIHGHFGAFLSIKNH